jgi:hypothetical protein
MTYCARGPWKWVFDESIEDCAPVPSVSSLSTSLIRNIITETPSLAQAYARYKGATISLDDRKGNNVRCVSGALDLLDNKDTFVETLKSSGLSYLSPPSTLIKWDEENITNDMFPVTIPSAVSNVSSTSSKPAWVLKTALGSQGMGIYFVQSIEDVEKHILVEARNARQYDGFLNEIQQKYGRLPHWVLQSQVPSLLVRNGRKCHLRTYVLVVEREDSREIDVYVYTRHEVRIASAVFDAESYADRGSHITNGAGKDLTERCLTTDVPELEGIEDELHMWVSHAFKALKNQLLEGVAAAREQDVLRINAEAHHLGEDMRGDGSYPPTETRFAFAGVDIMVDSRWSKLEGGSLRRSLGDETAGPFFILEVNRNPAGTVLICILKSIITTNLMSPSILKRSST